MQLCNERLWISRKACGLFPMERMPGAAIPAIDETTTTFKYGKITILPTGTQNQETIGAVDFGAIDGNEITIKLGLEKVNAAVGSNVLGTTSTNTQAKAQILIGSSLTGGLLLNADSGTGSSFAL